MNNKLDYMSNLDYLGGALNNLLKEEVEQPHLVAPNITVYEDGQIIASGRPSKIIDKLKDKYDRKINWDAYFHIVTLKIYIQYKWEAYDEEGKIIDSGVVSALDKDNAHDIVRNMIDEELDKYLKMDYWKHKIVGLE